MFTSTLTPSIIFLYIKLLCMHDAMTYQIEYAGFRQDSYLKFICRLFYRKGQALNVFVSSAICSVLHTCLTMCSNIPWSACAGVEVYVIAACSLVLTWTACTFIYIFKKSRKSRYGCFNHCF